MGPLSNDGFIIHKTPDLAHKLLKPENPLLRTLGRKFIFEIAVGLNGKIWVHAHKTSDVLNIIRAIECCEKMNEKQLVELCNKY